MNIDTLPVHWNFIFQITCLVSIVVIMWNVKSSDELDHLRHPDQVNGVLFMVRRASRFVMALSLCWLVIYAHERSWVVWPPFIFFLLAFDAVQITHILVMRYDLKRRQLYERMMSSSSPMPQRSARRF